MGQRCGVITGPILSKNSNIYIIFRATSEKENKSGICKSKLLLISGGKYLQLYTSYPHKTGYSLEKG
jgi:hypothetical protein